MGNPSVYNVVVWGDSIAAGNSEHNWPAIAEHLFNTGMNTGRPVRMINQSFHGKPAAQARLEFPERVAKHNPDLVIIQLGFNDMRYDGARGHQPISTLAEFASHLTEMVQLCRTQTKAKVILLGNHRSRSALILPTGLPYDQARAQYNQVVRAVAQEQQTPFYDLANELTMPHADWMDFVCHDGVHLSPLGYIAYAHFVVNRLREILAVSPS
ncbi:MAG: SGNH/GDSL hydrolase family protein [Phycisphaeraceae bacterium]|nr:SGNH/GDSL hydrolase family protein [Phycisphaeraceae bacterium]